MHLPVSDALRHHRVGLITTDQANILASVYVQDGSEETPRGEKPLESMARPYPHAIQAKPGKVALIEGLLSDPDPVSLSETLCEYIRTISHEHLDEEEYTDPTEFTSERDQFANPAEEMLAHTLHQYLQGGYELPLGVRKWLLEQISDRVGNPLPREEDGLYTNPVTTEINGQSTFDYGYLPEVEDIISHEIHRYISSGEVNGREVRSESVWVRVAQDEEHEYEFPLLQAQTEGLGFALCAKQVDFGNEDNTTTEASTEYIEDILNPETDPEDSLLRNAHVPEDTQTYEYLSEWIK